MLPFAQGYTAASAGATQRAGAGPRSSVRAGRAPERWWRHGGDQVVVDERAHGAARVQKEAHQGHAPGTHREPGRREELEAAHVHEEGPHGGRAAPDARGGDDGPHARRALQHDVRRGVDAARRVELVDDAARAHGVGRELQRAQVQRAAHVGGPQGRGAQGAPRPAAGPQDGAGVAREDALARQPRRDEDRRAAHGDPGRQRRDGPAPPLPAPARAHTATPPEEPGDLRLAPLEHGRGADRRAPGAQGHEGHDADHRGGPHAGRPRARRGPAPRGRGEGRAPPGHGDAEDGGGAGEPHGRVAQEARDRAARVRERATFNHGAATGVRLFERRHSRASHPA